MAHGAQKNSAGLGRVRDQLRDLEGLKTLCEVPS